MSTLSLYHRTELTRTPKTGRREPVPRYAEIPDLRTKKFCSALEIPEP